MTGEAAWGRGRHWNTVGPLVQPHPPLDRNAIGNTAIMPLASFMVVIPSADLSAAAGNPFLLGVLGRRQSGRDDSSSYDDKEKYEHSKWHVHRCQALRFLRRFRRRSRGEDIARTCESEWSHGTAATVLSAVRLTHSSARWLSYPTVYPRFDGSPDRSCYFMDPAVQATSPRNVQLGIAMEVENDNLFFGQLLQTGSFGTAQQQHHDSHACRFTVQANQVTRPSRGQQISYR